MSTQTLRLEYSARPLAFVDSRVGIASGDVRFAPKSRVDLVRRRWLKFAFLPSAYLTGFLPASLGIGTLNLDRSRLPEARVVVGPSGRSSVCFVMGLEVDLSVISAFRLFIKCLKALAVLTLLGSYGWSDNLLDPHYMEVLQVDL